MCRSLMIRSSPGSRGQFHFRRFFLVVRCEFWERESEVVHFLYPASVAVPDV
jgi:hypothetical protein